VARYDALKLHRSGSLGERARLARMLDGLPRRRRAPPARAWILAEESGAICRVQNGIAAGQAAFRRPARSSRVGRRATDARGPRREETSRRAAFAHCASSTPPSRSGRQGIVKGDAWDELLQLG